MGKIVGLKYDAKGISNKETAKADRNALNAVKDELAKTKDALAASEAELAKTKDALAKARG